MEPRKLRTKHLERILSRIVIILFLVACLSLFAPNRVIDEMTGLEIFIAINILALVFVFVARILPTHLFKTKFK